MNFDCAFTTLTVTATAVAALLLPACSSPPADDPHTTRAGLDWTGIVVDPTMLDDTELAAELDRASVEGHLVTVVVADDPTRLAFDGDLAGAGANDLVADADRHRKIDQAVTTIDAAVPGTDRDIFGALATLSGARPGPANGQPEVNEPPSCQLIVLGDGQHEVAEGASTTALDPDDPRSAGRLMADLQERRLLPDLAGCTLDIRHLASADRPDLAIVYEVWAAYAVLTGVNWEQGDDSRLTPATSTANGSLPPSNPSTHPLFIGVCSDVSKSMDEAWVASFHDALAEALLQLKPAGENGGNAGSPAPARPAMSIEARTVDGGSYGPGSLIASVDLPPIPAVNAAPTPVAGETSSDFRWRRQTWETEESERQAKVNQVGAQLDRFAVALRTAPPVTATATDVWGCIAALDEIAAGRRTMILISSDLVHTAGSVPQGLSSTATIVIVQPCVAIDTCNELRTTWTNGLASLGQPEPLYLRPEQAATELPALTSGFAVDT